MGDESKITGRDLNILRRLRRLGNINKNHKQLGLMILSDAQLLDIWRDLDSGVPTPVLIARIRDEWQAMSNPPGSIKKMLLRLRARYHGERKHTRPLKPAKPPGPFDVLAELSGLVEGLKADVSYWEERAREATETHVQRMLLDHLAELRKQLQSALTASVSLKKAVAKLPKDAKGVVKAPKVEPLGDLYTELFGAGE